MKMVLLGTGTSHGIPCIACKCRVCTSNDDHDKRLRCSAYVTNKNDDESVSHLLVDVGPEFRIQAIKNEIMAVDAVLLTHSHADHLHGDGSKAARCARAGVESGCHARDRRQEQCEYDAPRAALRENMSYLPYRDG